MVNIIIKNDERRAKEALALREFAGKVKNPTAQQREYAEAIVARTNEIGGRK